MKSKFSTIVLAVTLLFSLTACNSDKPFESAYNINAITREPGSGTRGAFLELFELEDKKPNGYYKDLLTKEASVENNTSTIITSVQDDKYAIGYISLGSLSDSVKPVKIDGIAPTAENIQNGTYKVKRSFNIITKKGNHEDVLVDFIDFVFSKQGQKIVSTHYVPVDSNASAYAGNKPAGTIIIGGSSSVAPIMEKIVEEYRTINPNAKVELQVNDSTTGISKTLEGAYDIGISSRSLKQTEGHKLSEQEFALDGIVIIVNKKNSFDNLSKQDVKNIYLGKTNKWEQLNK